MTPRDRWLIGTDALAAQLDDVMVLDGSWHLPPEKRDAAAEFITAHIPGAQFFDVDRIADTSTGLPHMLPPPALFAEAVGAMGISNGADVVVYDSKGLFSAARIWWTFRAMGHDRIRVLDGGLPKWRAEGRALETGAARVRAMQTFAPAPVPARVRTKAEVLATIASGDRQIVDARSAGRFFGRDPEPRPGLASGHMPGAKNLPYSQLSNPDGTVKDATGLAAAFSAAGIAEDRPITATCGSGMTAAVVVLSRALLGHDDAALYDGSWTEWGGDPTAPVVRE
jgi:thiosulfate/3-mercaptopyruvate sulfurtransferase